MPPVGFRAHRGKPHSKTPDVDGAGGADVPLHESVALLLRREPSFLFKSNAFVTKQWPSVMLSSTTKFTSRPIFSPTLRAGGRPKYTTSILLTLIASSNQTFVFKALI